MDKKVILDILWEYYGKESEFRDGQDEAILAALSNKRALVVQKTGWGKSLVYFLTTRVLRNSGKGPTIVISPLLALMNNQIESAEKFKLKAVTINSSNAENWDEVEQEVIEDKVDVLFISPERLGNKDFTDRILSKIEKNIGLLVVDEAHCISDWGHDFRPDYRRIVRIINRLPINVPMIATTATANNRVIKDIKKQLGDDLLILKGSLTRESISIDILKINDQASRLAWLSENLKYLPGTGIIYTLTKGDCNLVTEWLQFNGYNVESYYSGIPNNERVIKENKLMNNEIKALVATVALGMGFDKADISFVIHYQKPGNVIAYYQQIGRAGRAIANSNAILMCGEEDEEINNYFIDSAFPTQYEMFDVINIIKSYEGVIKSKILSEVNMKSGRLDKCLKFLEIEGTIYKEKNKYYPTVDSEKWKPDIEYAEEITVIRKHELQRMNDYSNTKECLMKFIAAELDDSTAKECGKCKNCLGYGFKEDVSRDNVVKAVNFLKRNFLIIEPRKRWPSGVNINNGKTTIKLEELMEKGIALCSYGDAGWGKVVKDGKYKYSKFSEELIEASYNLLKNKTSEWNIDTIVFVPSLKRPSLVRDFTKSLANKLNLHFLDAIIKKEDTDEQKTLENSFYQCINVIKGFGLNDIGNYELGNVLLVDDMVDSRWTFTYCTYLLKQGGAERVYPFALAKTSGNEVNN